MNNKEQEILYGLKSGDNRAYKHLYDCYYSLLCRVAYDFLKDDFLAQNLVDDLIFYIYEKRETLEITTSLRAYLIRSVRNRSINYLQSEQKKREVNFSAIDDSNHHLFLDLEDGDYPLASLLENELEQEINSAIERLPEECRTVFMKSRFEDKTYEAIAQELHISVNTVKYHMKNALTHLYKDLGKYLILILSLLRYF